jgi:hypothetical protein
LAQALISNQQMQQQHASAARELALMCHCSTTNTTSCTTQDWQLIMQ